MANFNKTHSVPFGFLSFTLIKSAIDQPAHHQHGVKKDWRKWNVQFQTTQKPINTHVILQRWHFIALVICKYISDLFQKVLTCIRTDAARSSTTLTNRLHASADQWYGVSETTGYHLDRYIEEGKVENETHLKLRANQLWVGAKRLWAGAKRLRVRAKRPVSDVLNLLTLI